DRANDRRTNVLSSIAFFWLVDAVAFVFSKEVQDGFILALPGNVKRISVKLGFDTWIGFVLEEQLKRIRVVVFDSCDERCSAANVIVVIDLGALLQKSAHHIQVPLCCSLVEGR